MKNGLIRPNRGRESLFRRLIQTDKKPTELHLKRKTNTKKRNSGEDISGEQNFSYWKNEREDMISSYL